MVDRERGAVVTGIHPIQAVLLAGSVPLFVGTLLCDWYYSATFEVQWINFASWLIVGAVLFAAPALVWAIGEALRFKTRRTAGALVYLVALSALVIIATINVLVHSKDAWATMPAGLILSVLASVLAAAAVWLGFSSLNRSVA